MAGFFLGARQTAIAAAARNHLGVETAVGDGMHVWVGDDVSKRESTRIVPVTTVAGRRWIDSHAAPRWLADTAARLFPKSRFARQVQLAHLVRRSAIFSGTQGRARRSWRRCLSR